MIFIRKGVFETNSSSTHSIIIAREGTEPLDQVVFSIGEYGWECEKYHDVNSKASYFYTAACACLRRDVADEISAMLSPYGIECIFYIKPVFVTYHSDTYGDSNYLDNGYIDHDMEAIDFVKGLLEDASQLIDFLFNDKSYVETGNDNDEEPVGTEIPDCEYIEYYKGN